MADLFQFETIEGYGVVIDLDAMVTCWQGKTPGCIVFVLMGVNDPLEVRGDFFAFVDDYLEAYDCRPKAKKKPHRTKRQSPSSSSIKVEASPLKASGA